MQCAVAEMLSFFALTWKMTRVEEQESVVIVGLVWMLYLNFGGRNASGVVIFEAVSSFFISESWWNKVAGLVIAISCNECLSLFAESSHALPFLKLAINRYHKQRLQ